MSRKSLLFIILAMLFNYKFYCICFLNTKITGKLKSKRFRNDQLYIKYCWHLSLEVLLILVQIFCVFSSCNYLPITIFYCVHQGILALLIAVIGKFVYRMLSLKKMKKEISKICKKEPENVNKDRENL